MSLEIETAIHMKARFKFRNKTTVFNSGIMSHSCNPSARETVKQDGEVESNLAYIVRACLQRDKPKHQLFSISYTVILCVCMYIFQASVTISIFFLFFLSIFYLY